MGGNCRMVGNSGPFATLPTTTPPTRWSSPSPRSSARSATISARRSSRCCATARPRRPSSREARHSEGHRRPPREGARAGRARARRPHAAGARGDRAVLRPRRAALHDPELRTRATTSSCRPRRDVAPHGGRRARRQRRTSPRTHSLHVRLTPADVSRFDRRLDKLVADVRAAETPDGEPWGSRSRSTGRERR